MKYKISNLLSITTHDDGTFSKTEASCALAVIGGLRHDEAASSGTANVFIGEDGAHYWIPKAVVAGAEPDFTEYASMPQLDTFNNPAFAQMLVRRMGLIVNPVVFEHGNLVGQWRVESNNHYGANDFLKSGWKHGSDEPVLEQSVSLTNAIAAAALRVAGVGRKAYVFKNDADGASTLIFLSELILNWIQANTDISPNLHPVPELDAYAIIGIDEDDAMEVITKTLTEKTETEAEIPPASLETETPAE